MSDIVSADTDALAGASVIIVGGGATGLSAGWWLARSGVDVLVIDKGIVAWEASGRNGGGCTHGFSPLFMEEQRLWPQMDELLGYPTEFCSGRIRIAMNERQWSDSDRMVRNGNHHGFRSEKLDAAQLRELVPLAADDVYGAWWHHFGGHANPHRTVQGYAWAMQDHGGRVLQHTTVLGFDIAGGKVTSVRTDRGTLGCDHLVLAAGPQSGKLAAMLGVTIPVVSARAEMIVTEPLPLMKVGGADGNGLYGRQTQRGNLAYGGGPHEWLDDADGMSVPPRSSTPLMGNIAGHLAEMFPKARHARIIRSWGGIIENTPDGRPVIDRLSDPSNVVVATLSSIGFGLSPASGHAVQQLVTDGACDFADLTPLRLSRFDSLDTDWIAERGWQSPRAMAAQPQA
jgi:sarcosine oxidase subunit beta